MKNETILNKKKSSNMNEHKAKFIKCFTRKYQNQTDATMCNILIPFVYLNKIRKHLRDFETDTTIKNILYELLENQCPQL